MADDQADTDEDPPLEPSTIAQFVEHDRCPRYFKQSIHANEEASARDWQEAFGLMNIALLGKGKEFEATQIEALAADATMVVGPELLDSSKAAVPDIAVDATWADSARGRRRQLVNAINNVATLTTTADTTPYILLYQAPLEGTLGDEAVYGDADCIALAPAESIATDSIDSNPEVVARVIDCKSAQEEQPAHRVQVAAYCALLEQTLAEAPDTPACQIEASVLTQHHAVQENDALSPFSLPTFRRAAWELFVSQLLADTGPVSEAIRTDLPDLSYAIDQVCDNCAYREACATRAVERPRTSQSLAMLGLNAPTQRSLKRAGLTSLHDIATLVSPIRDTTPMDDPPQLDLDPELNQTLTEALPFPVYELILRAQALYGRVQPMYPEFNFPPAIPGNDWVPLPDDRCAGWGDLDDTEPGELIHVSLFVRPDTAINRVAALGACVTADNYDDYLTVGEVIDAVPDNPSLAATVERDLFDRFLSTLFDHLETVATDLGSPEQSVLHCYTYSEHALDTLLDGLDRHRDDLDRAHALRELCSLHEHGHTDIDQSMVTPLQPVINDQFALQSISQGLLSVVDQFDQSWTIDTFDPLDRRPDAPPLREIFSEQFLNDTVPYLSDDDGIHLHLGRTPLAEGPAADHVDADYPDPDGWYRIRKRSGGQFPLEYVWAAVPQTPDDDKPRLHPDVVTDWAIDEDNQPLYRAEISRFYYRTNEKQEPLKQTDVAYLAERLSYSLQRLVEAIPYKDAYRSKEPLDLTQLATFSMPVTDLPGAARDYLHMEAGARRDTTLAQYQLPPRDRVRGGRSIPIRCQSYTVADDGTLTIRATLAYDALVADPTTAATLAQRIRVQGGDGTGGGSWRVLTRLTSDEADSTSTDSSPRYTAAHVDTSAEIKHSPPVTVEDIDFQTGEVVLQAFAHRFRRCGSPFRVDHCGWQTSSTSNLSDPDKSPAARSGYIAQRPPVQIATNEIYMLDPMLDDFAAPKADQALQPDTIKHNALWQHIQSYQQTGALPTVSVASTAAIMSFVDALTASTDCLTPNSNQQEFITSVDRPLVPLQGPPGTGKTSGAVAPALLARAYAYARHEQSFTGLVVAPAHEAVDATLAGVVECLDDWLRTHTALADLDLVRILPALPAQDSRVDTDARHVDVSYCTYHSNTDAPTLQRVIQTLDPSATDNTSQQLLFVTPPTLYQLLGVVGTRLSAVDAGTAPAVMRYPPGLVDVVCADEASMLSLPQLFLATSVLAPAGQTLLAGDHRQLATVTERDWAQIRRRPVTETQAHRSALEYVQWLCSTSSSAQPPINCSLQQSRLGQFRTDTGGEIQ